MASVLTVLGLTPQDRGSQLEILTLKILRDKGYQNIRTRHISTGGAEIDVLAEKSREGTLGQHQPIVICECKAHEAPISTTDWLKFIGKIYCERQKYTNNVYGELIALNGVNGNVAGSARELAEHDASITVIEGDQLSRELVRTFGLPSLKEITSRIQDITSTPITSANLIFHDPYAAWLVVLGNDTYTVIGPGCEELTTATVDNIDALISERFGNITRLDIKQEIEQSTQMKNAELWLLSSLVVANGNATLDSLAKIGDKPNEASLRDAARRLQNLGLIRYNEASGSAELIADPHNPSTYSNVIRQLASYGHFYIHVIDSDWWNNQCTSEIRNEISRIQHGLPIFDETWESLEQIMKWSPSAFASVLHPQRLIVYHRANQPGSNNPSTDAHDNAYLVEIAMNAFRHDFEQGSLKKWYYENLGIVELAENSNLAVKSATETTKVFSCIRRTSIGLLSPEHGGGYILIRMLPDAPEPWNMPNGVAKLAE